MKKAKQKAALMAAQGQTAISAGIAVFAVFTGLAVVIGLPIAFGAVPGAIVGGPMVAAGLLQKIHASFLRRA